jgi:multidrug efflux pump subunit AcrB
MFNPAKYCLRNTRTAWVIYTVLMLLGIHSYLNIGRQEYPDFTIRTANIITAYPGRTSSQVEQQVTEPIEQAIRQMPEIKEIKSTSKNGVSIVTVELLDTIFDMEPIWQDLRNKVVGTTLPQGVQEPEIQDEIGEVFPFLYALTSDGYEPHEVVKIGNEIRDQLLKVKGVAKVELHGAQQERIYVEYSSAKLESLGLSPDVLARELQNQNTVANSGTVVTGIERLTIMTQGEYTTLDGIRKTRLSVPGEATSIYLSGIAKVKRGYLEPSRGYSHYNGEKALCIAVSMIKGGVITNVGTEVQNEIDLIQESLPIGLDIERMFFQPEYVEESIRSFLINIGQAFFSSY